MKKPILQTSFKAILSLLIITFSSAAFAEIKTKEVRYELNEVKLNGYLAWDDNLEGKRPGILVVHEWWGHNDYARKRARDLAKEGYVAFALDMYGDEKLAKHPDDANKFMMEILPRYSEMLARFNAAKAQLKKSSLVDQKKIAAIGYCFGGAVVLNVARSDDPANADLAGVVSFHGNLAPVRKSDSVINTPILVMNGADDPFVKTEAIENFKKEMSLRKASFEFINYPGVKHSFTNPGATKVGEQFKLPLEYNEEADKLSWAEMLKFFDKVFAKKEG